MSLLLSLLGWTKLPPWVIELAVVVLVAGGVWLYHDHVTSKLLAAGRAQQMAEDTKALNDLKADRDQKQEILQARADTAQKAYQDEHTDLNAYRFLHPDRPPDKLCINAPYRGSPDLHSGARTSGGVATGPSTPSILQPVPGPDSVVRPDRRGLLDALAALADQTSSQVREFQRR